MLRSNQLIYNISFISNPPFCPEKSKKYSKKRKSDNIKRFGRHTIGEEVESISHRADFEQGPNLSTFDAIPKVRQSTKTGNQKGLDKNDCKIIQF